MLPERQGKLMRMQRRSPLVFLIALLLGTTFALSACGRKGPLFIPDNDKSTPTRSIPYGK